MKKSKYDFEMICLTFLLSLCVLFVIFLIAAHVSRNQINKKSFELFVIGNYEDFSCQISEITTVKDKLIIRGWAIQKNHLSSYFNYGLDVHAEGIYNRMYVGCVSNHDMLLFPTQLYKPISDNNMINNDIDYGNSGFVAEIPLSFLSKKGVVSLSFCFCDQNGNWVRYDTEEQVVEQ